MSALLPEPALLGSFVNLQLRWPEGSVVFHAAVPRVHVDEIAKGFGLPPGPPDALNPNPTYPPLIVMAARRWPSPGEPDAAVIVEQALTFVKGKLSDPDLPITGRIGACLADLLQTLTERADLRHAFEEHLR